MKNWPKRSVMWGTFTGAPRNSRQPSGGWSMSTRRPAPHSANRAGVGTASEITHSEVPTENPAR